MKRDRVDKDIAKWANDWCDRHAHIIDGYVAVCGEANQIRELDQRALVLIQEKYKMLGGREGWWWCRGCLGVKCSCL